MLLGGIPYNLGSTLSGARMCILIGAESPRSSRSKAGGLTGVSKSKGVICLPSRASTNQRARAKGAVSIYKRACFVVPTPPSSSAASPSTPYTSKGSARKAAAAGRSAAAGSVIVIVNFIAQKREVGGKKETWLPPPDRFVSFLLLFNAATSFHRS